MFNVHGVDEALAEHDLGAIEWELSIRGKTKLVMRAPTYDEGLNGESMC